MDQVPDLVLAGVPAILIIIGLVEYVKSLGVPSEWCPLVAIGLGVLAGVAKQLMAMYPFIEPWVVAVISGLVVGMAATGLYKVGDSWANRSA